MLSNELNDMKYFEVYTRSHTGKSKGLRLFYAEDENHAKQIMRKKGLPVYSIREIKPPKK